MIKRENIKYEDQINNTQSQITQNVQSICSQPYHQPNFKNNIEESLYTCTIDSLQPFLFLIVIFKKLKLKHTYIKKSNPLINQKQKITIYIVLNHQSIPQIMNLLGDYDLTIQKSQQQMTKEYEKYYVKDYFRNLFFQNSKIILLRTHYLDQNIKDFFSKNNYFFQENQIQIISIAENTFILKDLSLKKIKFENKSILQNKIYGILQPSNSTCFIQIKQDQSQLQILSKLLQDNYKDYTINYFIEIGNKIQVYIGLSFKNEELFCTFLQDHYRKYQKILQLTLNTNHLKITMKQNSLDQLNKSIQERMLKVEKHLTLYQPTYTPQIPSLLNNNQMLNHQIYQNDQYDLMQSSITEISFYDEILQKLYKGDILALQNLWQDLSYKLREILENWEINKKFIDYKFLKLISTLHFKINYQFNIMQNNQSFNLYQRLYPNITQIINLFITKLRIKIVKQPQKNTRIKYTNPNNFSKIIENQSFSNYLDSILLKYIEQIFSINNNQGHLTITIKQSQKKSLKNHISSLTQFNKYNSKWSDIFNCLTINLSNSKNKKITQQYLKTIQFQRYPNLTCLGCTKFYYHKYTNIQNQSKIYLKLFPCALQLKTYQVQIIQTICSMLNNKGGIILFNCMRQYLKILPIGTVITQKDKQAIENRINHYLGFIYPKPEINNIIISFIPLINHPTIGNSNRNSKVNKYKGIDQQIKTNQIYYDRQYQQGVYITRIKIYSNDPSIVYLYNNGNGNHYLYGNHQQVNKQIPIKYLRYAIKQKMNRSNQEKNDCYSFRNKSFGNPLNHICQIPDSGIKVEEKGKLELAKRQLPKINNQFNYNYMSLICIKKAYINEFRDKLKSKGIRCQIEIRFQQHKFKSAKDMAILYHDCRHEDILRIVMYNPQYQFQGRNVIVIIVTNYIKLIHVQKKRQITSQMLKQTQEWLKISFPNEILKAYEYKTNQTSNEFYLETGSKLSTVFIYFVLGHSGIKVNLKNPIGFDRLNQSQRKLCMQEIKYNNCESQEYVLNVSSRNEICNITGRISDSDD